MVLNDINVLNTSHFNQDKFYCVITTFCIFCLTTRPIICIRIESSNINLKIPVAFFRQASLPIVFICFSGYAANRRAGVKYRSSRAPPPTRQYRLSSLSIQFICVLLDCSHILYNRMSSNISVIHSFMFLMVLKLRQGVERHHLRKSCYYIQESRFPCIVLSRQQVRNIKKNCKYIFAFDTLYPEIFFVQSDP